jgi:hypothetical protein
VDLFPIEAMPWLTPIFLGFLFYQQSFNKKGHPALMQEQLQAQRELVTEARQLNVLLKRVVDEQSARIAVLEAKYEAIAGSGPPSRIA